MHKRKKNCCMSVFFSGGLVNSYKNEYSFIWQKLCLCDDFSGLSPLVKKFSMRKSQITYSLHIQAFLHGQTTLEPYRNTNAAEWCSIYNQWLTSWYYLRHSQKKMSLQTNHPQVYPNYLLTIACFFLFFTKILLIIP